MSLPKRFYLLVALSLLLILSACSSPREQHADALLNKLDKVHTALVKYKQNPSGVTFVVGQGIEGQRSLSVDAAIKTKDFFDSFSQVNYEAFRDIQKMDGYDAWATELTRKLREKSDACLKIVLEIKSEYKQNQENPEYRKMLFVNNIPDQRLPLLWLSNDDYLVFALAAGRGVPVEMILKVDFRGGLDSLRNQGKGKDK
jgi:hypothetical protein